MSEPISDIILPPMQIQTVRLIAPRAYALLSPQILEVRAMLAIVLTLAEQELCPPSTASLETANCINENLLRIYQRHDIRPLEL